MRFHEELKNPGQAGTPASLDAHVVRLRFDGMGHLVAETEMQARSAVCTSKAKTKCIKCDVGIYNILKLFVKI